MNKIIDVQIRSAVLADMKKVSALMQESAFEFIADELSSAAAEHMLKSLSEDSLKRSCSEGVEYWVAEYKDSLAGVFGVKSSHHVLHCFVKKRFHRCGVGLAMWQFVRREILLHESIDQFTVNSSCYAIPFYEALGFVAVSALTVVKGVKFVPMRLWNI